MLACKIYALCHNCIKPNFTYFTATDDTALTLGEYKIKAQGGHTYIHIYFICIYIHSIGTIYT